MRYHSTFTRQAIILKSIIPSVDKDAEQWELQSNTDGRVKTGGHKH